MGRYKLSENGDITMSKYCVIGAGPAGLASMKTLVDAGLEFDCFERTQLVGGHWNNHLEQSNRL